MELEERLNREGRRGDDQANGARKQDLAAIERIRDGASPQPEHDERNETEKPGEAHVHRIARDRPQLRGHCHHGQLRANNRDDVRVPQPRKIWVCEWASICECAL